MYAWNLNALWIWNPSILRQPYEIFLFVLICWKLIIFPKVMYDISPLCSVHLLQGHSNERFMFDLPIYAIIILGVPEKVERWIFSTLRTESVVYFYIIRWSVFRRWEWCLDHSVCFWNMVIFKFCWIFATDERWNVVGQIFHTVFYGSPLIRGNKRTTKQSASTGRCMDCLSGQNSSLICPKNPAKCENDRISRNGHRL